MRLVTVVVSLGVVVSPALSPVVLTAAQPETLSHAIAVQHFQANVAHYMTLRQTAVATVGAPHVAMPAQALYARTQALAAAIRTLRPAARPGDIFAADVRVAFRLVVAQAMTRHADTTARIMARASEDMVPCDARPAVNEPFPWQLGAMMPPYLLTALPALPAGLQYRIVERDLILLDLDANLVVDILKDALPPPD